MVLWPWKSLQIEGKDAERILNSALPQSLFQLFRELPATNVEFYDSLTSILVKKVFHLIRFQLLFREK